MEQNGDGNRELAEVIPRVEKAAAQAAIQILGIGATELIQEVVAETNLRLVQTWRRNPPADPVAWAFKVALNYAKRLGRKITADRHRYAELDDNLILRQSTGGSSTISVEAGLETLDRLVELTNRIIHSVGGDEDRRIVFSSTSVDEVGKK